MTRKARHGTTGEAVRMIATAASAVSPPSSVPLSAADLSFFDAIIAEAALSEWTSHTVEVAALLARSMADLEREQRLLRAEGSVLASDRGSPVVNPRSRVVADLTAAILSSRRSLQLHARAQTRDLAVAAARRRALKALEADLPPRDSLLG